jgi:hypothetical protein
MTKLPEFKTYTQTVLLSSFRQVDQVLSKAMAELLYGAGFKTQFAALELARTLNVDSCAKALRQAGMDQELYLEQAIAANFAEAFAHYWPELDAKNTANSQYVAGVKVDA